MSQALERAVRGAAGRVIAALAARFRDLDVAEDAFSEACLSAARSWPRTGEPADAAAWLYRVAFRHAVDDLRRRAARARLAPDPPEAAPNAEDQLADEAHAIADERLRLIFVCCHPAIAPKSRAALTLRLVCGLPAEDIAQAFLVSPATLLQRLTRAKRKIAEAGVPFEVPGPDGWPERLEAVLSTLEIAYAMAHADAAGAGAHAGFAAEVLHLTSVLVDMLPGEGEALGLAALVRYAEARRPARLDADGLMSPLAEQDPALWSRPLIAAGDAFLHRAANLGAHGPRALTAAIHGVWCARRGLADPAPWPDILALYDAMLASRDDVVVRLNRAVALAEVEGPAAAFAELDRLAEPRLDTFQPWHAVRADLLRRLGRLDESRAAYDRAIGLAPGPAERAWLAQRRP